MRCFVAIRFPEQINRDVEREIRQLAATDAAVRWVRTENLHVTLKFLGDVNEDLLGDVHVALSRVARPSMSLSVRGLGWFPPAGRPRVVWAGIEGDVESLVALAGDIERQVAALGFPAERRRFQTHLTLGRVKGPHKLDALMLEAERRRGRLATSAVVVDAFGLYQSELGGGGPRYQRIRTYSLTATGT